MIRLFFRIYFFCIRKKVCNSISLPTSLKEYWNRLAVKAAYKDAVECFMKFDNFQLLHFLLLSILPVKEGLFSSLASAVTTAALVKEADKNQLIRLAWISNLGRLWTLRKKNKSWTSSGDFTLPLRSSGFLGKFFDKEDIKECVEILKYGFLCSTLYNERMAGRSYDDVLEEIIVERQKALIFSISFCILIEDYRNARTLAYDLIDKKEGGN